MIYSVDPPGVWLSSLQGCGYPQPLYAQTLTEPLNPTPYTQKSTPEQPLSKRQEWFKKLGEQKAWQKEQKKKKSTGQKDDKKGADWWSGCDGPDHKKWGDWQDWSDGSSVAPRHQP